MTGERPLLFLEARLSRVVKGIKNTLSCDNRTEILQECSPTSLILAEKLGFK